MEFSAALQPGPSSPLNCQVNWMVCARVWLLASPIMSRCLSTTGSSSLRWGRTCLTDGTMVKMPFACPNLLRSTGPQVSPLVQVIPELLPNPSASSKTYQPIDALLQGHAPRIQGTVAQTFLPSPLVKNTSQRKWLNPGWV